MSGAGPLRALRSGVLGGYQLACCSDGCRRKVLGSNPILYVEASRGNISFDGAEGDMVTSRWRLSLQHLLFLLQPLLLLLLLLADRVARF